MTKKTDIGPPDYRMMLPESIRKPWKWKYHETLKPGFDKCTFSPGKAIPCGRHQAGQIDFIRDM